MTRTLLHTIDDQADEGERADVVLGRRIPALSRRVARNLAREGKLRIDGQRQPPSARVRVGQTLALTLDDEPEPASPLAELELLAITERFVYVNKPAGIHTVALTPNQPGVLATAVAQRWPECASASEDPREGGAVHRLDQPTSGVVAFARSAAAWAEARAAFTAGRVTKHYLAACEDVAGCWPPALPDDGLRGWIEPTSPLTGFADQLAPLIGEPGPELASVRIRAAIGRDGPRRSAVRLDGRRASTVVQPLAKRGDRRLVRLLLETGCRHQARVHLAWIGLPIIGDTVYGTATGDSAKAAIHLHAFAIDLSAVSVNEVPVFAPPPSSFWPGEASATPPTW
ncbi:MAG: pseudouridine synthase [Enhygromyxa sp.]